MCWLIIGRFVVNIGQTQFDRLLASLASIGLPLKRDSSYGRCLAENMS